MLSNHSMRQDTVGGVPPELLRNVESTLTQTIVAVVPKHGGLSSAIKARLDFDDGSHAFFKACSSTQSEPSFSRLLYEIEAHRAKSISANSATMLCSASHESWQCLVTEFVTGDTIELSDPGQISAVWNVIEQEARRNYLTDPPKTLKRLSVSARGWADSLNAAGDLVYQIAPKSLENLIRLRKSRWLALSDKLRGSTLCHWDMTPGNLIRADSRVVMVDWGLARIGPVWADLYKLVVESGAAASLYASRLVDSIESHDPVDDLLDLSLVLGLNYRLRAARYRIASGEAIFERRCEVADKLFHVIECLRGTGTI